MRSEVERAKKYGSPARFLCGRVFIPDKNPHAERPICKTCEKAHALALKTDTSGWRLWGWFELHKRPNYSLAIDFPLAA